MPRGYTVATAALALSVSSKWLDNVLSHNRVAGVLQTRQGVARRLSVDGLLIVALALWLTTLTNLSTYPSIEAAALCERMTHILRTSRIRLNTYEAHSPNGVSPAGTSTCSTTGKRSASMILRVCALSSTALKGFSEKE